MIFSYGKRWWILGGLLLGLAGCTGRPPSSSNPPDVSSRTQPEPVAQPSPESVSESPSESTPDPTTEQSAIAPSEADIWSQLREADTHYYILMRHAIAPGTGDPSDFDLGDCSTQRNLSEAGRAQARRTGELFRQKNVAVAQVLSSEWCRCLDTASLLDLGPVEPFPALNSFFQNRALGPERTERLQAFMVENRDQPQVTVMVTHFVNISAIAGSGVSSGEMVVMTYDQDQLEVVDRIEAQ